MKMQSLYLMLMIFSVGNLAQDFVQLYCGNDEYIRVIKIRKGGDFEGVMVRAECENSQGGRSKQTPIRYSTSGKDLVTTKLMINYVYLNQAVKKEQASRFCAADVCMCQSVNQLHNNQKMAKLVLFTLLGKDHPNQAGFTHLWETIAILSSHKSKCSSRTLC